MEQKSNAPIPAWARGMLGMAKLTDLQARRYSLRGLGADCLLAGFIMHAAGLGRWAVIAFVWGAISFARAGRIANQLKEIKRKVSSAVTIEDTFAAAEDPASTWLCGCGALVNGIGAACRMCGGTKK